MISYECLCYVVELMSKDQLKIVLAMVLILLGTCTTLKIMMTSSYVGIPKCHALMFLVC